jgi:hypothetical protein
MNRPNVADHSFGMTPRSSNASPPHITKMRTAVGFLARRYCIVSCRSTNITYLTSQWAKETLHLVFAWPVVGPSLVLQPRSLRTFHLLFAVLVSVSAKQVSYRVHDAWKRLTMFMIIIKWLDFSRWCTDNSMGLLVLAWMLCEGGRYIYVTSCKWTGKWKGHAVIDITPGQYNNTPSADSYMARRNLLIW